MFTICSWCLKSCHDGAGAWRQICKKELCLVAEPTSEVSHGLCPPCFKRETAEAELAERREAWLELKNPKRSPISGELIEGTGL